MPILLEAVGLAARLLTEKIEVKRKQRKQDFSTNVN